MRSVPLGDLVESFDHLRVPVATSKRVPGPYPYYGASGVIDHVEGFLFDGEYLLISEDGENLRSRTLPIAFLARGQFWVNNHAHVLQGKAGVADTRYLAYALSATDVSPALSGSAQPKLSQASMNQLMLAVPNLKKQQAIAEVLGALDDKIAANGRTLEVARQLRAAHARRLVVADRKKQRLDEVTVFLGRGKAPAYTEDPEAQWVINQKCVRDGAVSLSEARRTSRVTDTDRNLRFGDVLVNSTGMGTLGRVGVWTGSVEATVDSHVTIVRFDPSAFPLCHAELVLAAEQAITALGEGSTGQTELSRALLGQVELPKLNSHASAMESTLQRLHQMDLALRCESERLAQLRDTLLPALMDGTLRVKDAVAQAEEVL